MKTERISKRFKAIKGLLACASIGWMCMDVSTLCQAQSSPATIAPGLQEVVKLTQAAMGDDAILAYIKNSGASYSLSADDMLYLKSQGVTQPVISALLNTKVAVANYNQPQLQAPPQNVQPPVSSQISLAGPAPAAQYAPPPVPAAQPAPMAQPEPGAPPVGGPEINFQYFHDQLSPFGAWVEIPGVGACWKPADTVINMSPGWRPYYDNGQWVQTENGLFWQSDYTWGDIPFHYGRWIRNPALGWLWAPDYTWGPAWVFWRHAETDGAIGWAALPPGAVFADGAFLFNGVSVGVNFEFGLGEDCFTFVDYGHFHERYFRLHDREYRYHVDHERMHGFYGRSVVRNEFRHDEHGRFVNNGIGRDRVEHLTHVEHAKMEERNPVGDKNHEMAKTQMAKNTVNPNSGPKTGGAPATGGGKTPTTTASYNKPYVPPVTHAATTPTPAKSTSTPAAAPKAAPALAKAAAPTKPKK